MTYTLDLHRSGPTRRRRARRRDTDSAPRPRWTAQEPAAGPAGDRPDWPVPAAGSAVDGSRPLEAAAPAVSDGAGPREARPAPAFRRLVVFGSLDATADRPAT